MTVTAMCQGESDTVLQNRT